MKKAILVFLFILFFLFIPQTSAYANHRQRVLGVSTASSALQIPPTIEGPGLILPDSPFFFLDELKQKARLFFAFAPEEKAKIHANIAGERLAELRFMLARNNRDGINTTLQGVANNFLKAADNLEEAKLSGKDVSALAKKINNDIKIKRQSIDLLEYQTTGELNARIAAVQESIDEAKIEFEDSLPDDEIENEIEDSLNRKIEREVHNASESAQNMSRAIDMLTREASDAASKSQKRREEALLNAIEKKNESLRRLEEKRLAREKIEQESLLKVNQEARIAAREAVEKAQKAAEKFKEAKLKADEIRTSNVSEVIEVEQSTSNTSSNSGSNSFTSPSE